jgi:signal transduction histidine kinase
MRETSGVGSSSTKSGKRADPKKTRLREALEEARHERDLLRLALDEVDAPIVVSRLDGALLCANKTGVQVVQMNEGLLALIAAQLPRDSSYHHRELELRDPASGRHHLVQVSSKPLLNAAGQACAIVSRFRDAANPEPAEQGALEQRLFESEKLAALGRLAATVAHEINNPLEAILNALYLLESRTSSNDPNRTFLEIASRETKRVSAIVRQMLGLYRGHANVAPVDINSSLRESAALLDHQLRMQHASVAFELDSALPPAKGNPDQFKQVFMNLILNASEAMLDGGTIVIRTQRSGAEDEGYRDDNFVLVRISDSGMGIPGEHLESIFEPFYSTKHGNSGSGLGLWVSRGIVENFGGQISVSSRLGHGTTFSVALPQGHES